MTLRCCDSRKRRQAEGTTLVQTSGGQFFSLEQTLTVCPSPEVVVYRAFGKNTIPLLLVLSVNNVGEGPVRLVFEFDGSCKRCPNREQIIQPGITGLLLHLPRVRKITAQFLCATALPLLGSFSGQISMWDCLPCGTPGAANIENKENKSS